MKNFSHKKQMHFEESSRMKTYYEKQNYNLIHKHKSNKNSVEIIIVVATKGQRRESENE
jgi:uncharacterized protein (DUF1330 family)